MRNYQICFIIIIIDLMAQTKMFTMSWLIMTSEIYVILTCRFDRLSMYSHEFVEHLRMFMYRLFLLDFRNRLFRLL